MAGTPPVYSLLYRCTNISNRKMNGQAYLAKTAFQVLVGDESAVGEVVAITVRHYHSEVYQHIHSYTASFYWGSGSVATSDTIQKNLYTGMWITNTISAGLPTAAQFAQWYGVQIDATGDQSTHYWRATKNEPLDVVVYYYDKKDLVDGASPPTVSGISHSDESGLRTTFGNYVQIYSDATITGSYKLDANYPYLSASHTLTLVQGGATIYSATQTDNAVFNVGSFAGSGTVSWTYTVLDSAGNRVSKAGTFSVLAYAPPTVSARVAGTAIAQRYASVLQDDGSTTYVAAPDGNHVWFNATVKVSAVASKNAWTLTMAYGQGDPNDSATAKTIASGTNGASAAVKTYTNDRTVIAEPISPASDYWFRLTVTDAVTSSSILTYVDKMEASLDVELYGVSVGMISTATQKAPKFEVAETHESFLHGGISGVTNYKTGEVETGGHWIDGKPIYRYTFALSTIAAGANKQFTLPSAVDALVRWYGYRSISGGTKGVLPHVTLDQRYNVELGLLDSKTVVVACGQYASIAGGYCAVEYTKATSSDPGISEGPSSIALESAPDAAIARTDYLAMRMGIEIPDGEGMNEIQSDETGMEAPGIGDEAPRSVHYDLVARYFAYDVWSEQMVRDAVGRWITEAEAKTILTTQKEGE